MQDPWPHLEHLENLLTLLANAEKVIEDDTCFERIVTNFNILLTRRHELESEFSLNKLTTILSSCYNILSTCKEFSPSTISFCMKMITVIVIDIKPQNDEEFVKIIVNFPSSQKELFTTSVQNNWLWCLSMLCEQYTVQIVRDINISVLFLLYESSSMFIEKSSKKFIAKIIVKSSEPQYGITCNIFYENMKEQAEKLPIEKFALIFSEMCKLNCEMALKALTKDLKMGQYFQDKNNRMTQAAHDNERWLSDLVLAIYETRNVAYEVTSSVLPWEVVLNLLHIILTKHPTNKNGTLCLLALYHHRLDMDSKACQFVENAINMPIDYICGRVNKDDSQLTAWFETITNVMCHRRIAQVMVINYINVCFDEETVGEQHKVILQKLSLLLSLIPNAPLEETPIHINVVSVLHQNWTIAKAILCVIEKLIKTSSESFASQHELCESVFKILENPEIDYKLFEISGRVAIKLICLCGSNDMITRYCHYIHRKITDIRWNVKDSALELAVLVINTCPVGSITTVQEFFTKPETLQDIKQCLHDDSSYVRSSAIKLLMGMLQFSTHVRDFAVAICKDIIYDDKEAFARRSAVQMLDKYLKTKQHIFQETVTYLDINAMNSSVGKELNFKIEAEEICHIILRCLLHDLDWEVRKNALRLLEMWKNIGKNDKVEKLIEILCQDFDEVVKKEAIKTFRSETSNQCSFYQERLELKNLLESAIIFLDKSEIESLSHHSHGIDDEVILDCY